MKLNEAKLKALLNEAFSSMSAARCFAQFAPGSMSFVANPRIMLKKRLDRTFSALLADTITNDEPYRQEIQDAYDSIRSVKDRRIFFQLFLREMIAITLYERDADKGGDEMDYLAKFREYEDLYGERVINISETEEFEHPAGGESQTELIHKCLMDVWHNPLSPSQDKRKWLEDVWDFVPRPLPRNYDPEFAGAATAVMETIKHMIKEELTKSDKAEIKRMISKELDKSLKKELKKALEDELTKALNSKTTKEEIGEITKKVIKKLYKDLSFHHPYIIDRIKV